jgi:hypothetical protein
MTTPLLLPTVASMSSVMLRGTSQSARAEECDAKTGALEMRATA